MADEKETDSHDIQMTPFNIVRYTISIGLLIFSIILVGALMFTGNTRVASETNPWVAIIVCVSGRRGSNLDRRVSNCRLSMWLTLPAVCSPFLGLGGAMAHDDRGPAGLTRRPPSSGPRPLQGQSSWHVQERGDRLQGR